MFTGLVKEIGRVVSALPNKEGKELAIASSTLVKQVEIDDSVAVNGVCQTVTRIENDKFFVQAVHTSLEKTTLGALRSGDEVNLELALTLQDRLGGHIVQGHVNDVGRIVGITSIGNNYLVSIQLSNENVKYVVKEGSITIDGISLTVAEFDRNAAVATVSIIPHTWENTILRNKKVGSNVNIEVDILAKYVESLFMGREQATKKDISAEWLRSKGF